MGKLLTLDEVAERLNVHVKTVRRYVHAGRLKAKRLGKEYRVNTADLQEFTGAPETPARSASRHIVVSTIVDVDAIDQAESERLSTLLLSAMNARPPDGTYPRVDTIFYPDHTKLRITITAGLETTATLLRVVYALLEPDASR